MIMYVESRIGDFTVAHVNYPHYHLSLPYSAVLMFSVNNNVWFDSACYISSSTTSTSCVIFDLSANSDCMPIAKRLLLK